ncbi:MAG: tetratricopeptide (TPR) repeat protein [Myxococcota bacterium]|jgi:tetratricopeptide (TPR) repeat protein
MVIVLALTAALAQALAEVDHEVAARTWVSAAQDDPAAWTALAEALDDPDEAEWAAQQAIGLAPGHVPALLRLAEARTAQGRPERALVTLEAAVEADGDVAEAWLALTAARQLTGDASGAREAARTALTRFPDHPGAWVAAAGLDDDHGLSRLIAARVRFPAHLGVAEALADAALRAGQADVAADALADASPAVRQRLRPWEACVASGALDGGGYSAAADARRARVLLGPVPTDDLVQRYPACGMVYVHRAALRRAQGDPLGALDDLARAVVLLPADPVASAAYGLALLHGDRPGEARRWLDAALAARPWDADLALLQARAALADGDAPGAREVLTAALTAHGPRADLSTALAALVDDRHRSLDLLLAALARTPGDAALEAASREVAESLGRTDEVAEAVAALAALRAAQAPPSLADDTEYAEEVVVWGDRPSDALREAIDAKLQDMGYPAGQVRDGRTVYPSQGDLPALTLHHHGLLDLQEVMVEVKMAVDPATLAPTLKFGRVNRRQMAPRRMAVLEGLRPELRAWRDQLAVEGSEDGLPDLVDRLDALWHDGVPLAGGAPVSTPEARRAALLDLWASRTCTPAGELVRGAIARYLSLEVDASEHPLTVDELASEGACGGRLR